MNQLKKIKIPAFIIASLLLVVAIFRLDPGGQAQKKDHKVKQEENAKVVSKKGNNKAVIENAALPAFSITTDPDNLWSKEKGIYILGDHASSKYPYKGANYWQDWSIPVDVEYIEHSKAVYSVSAEMAIFGGETRTLPQRSFALFAKKKQGSKTFNFPLFPEKALDKYKSFVLRNGGQDFAKTHMLDGLVSTLVRDTTIDHQAYRPVVVYLNDEYWGIYDLREKIDDNFLAANHGVKKKDVDLLEANAIEKDGSNKDYLQLIDFIKKNHVMDADNYNQVKKQMDMDNFIDYVITELYIANTDWPSHNIRFWKAKGEFDKWRWILYDSDLSFDNYQENTVDRLFTYKGKGDDSLYISFLFRELMKNDQFRKEFRSRADYHLAETFQPERVIATITKLQKQIEPEMPNHLEKWGGEMAEWELNVSKLKEFAENRPHYLKKDLEKLFDTLQ
ncbi:hypothetical protein BABA_11026 [Neobacillus bataviensis LMG 21833]|uniref:Spore coat protein CotH n=1 Tax=Neobacillus bataviensis LMG 21833 TaxID=1117379 RepID=K6D9N0_9BACI|nr:CotH kinase family protein [Neobacillus bataviensis]EKN69242.1 hypothetical protein BABA_11026 [Neobacillus bataviensis LMG 21833]